MYLLIYVLLMCFWLQVGQSFIIDCQGCFYLLSSRCCLLPYFQRLSYTLFPAIVLHLIFAHYILNAHCSFLRTSQTFQLSHIFNPLSIFAYLIFIFSLAGIFICKNYQCLFIRMWSFVNQWRFSIFSIDLFFFKYFPCFPYL